MRRFSFFWIIFAACTACSIASGIAASLIMSYSESQNDAILAARAGAKGAQAAKAAINVSSDLERATLLDAYAGIGQTFTILPAKNLPGRKNAQYDTLAHEMGALIRTERSTDGAHRIFYIGSPLDEEEWLWSRFEQPLPQLFKAAERGALAGLIASLLGGLAALFVAKLTAQWIKRAAKSAASAEHGLLVESKAYMPSEFVVLEHTLARMSERLCNEAKEREIALAGISHDAKNPLARIVICAETCSDPEMEETLSKACTQIGELLDDFTEYARSKEPKTETFDLVGTALRGFERAHLEGIEIALIGFDTLFWACGDPQLFERAVLNLALNSKKHGQLPALARFSVDPQNHQASIRFEDQGQSIRAEQMRMYSKPFIRGDASRSTPGSGLGLAISTRASEACSGTLEFFDKPEGGFYAVFKIPPAILPHLPQ